MDKKDTTYFEKYIDAYDFVKGNIPLETDGDDLKTVLNMLDLIQSNGSNIRIALEMLKDARTILLEMTTV